MFKNYVLLSVLAFAAIFAGEVSAQDGHGALGAKGLRETDVAATAADPGLKTEAAYDLPSIVIVPEKPTRRELVVYLPGTHDHPKADGLLQTVAAGGYRVIGLMYPNVPSEKQVCGTGNDPKCAARFREERVAGDAPDAVVQNSVEDSITSRLVHLLKYLDEKQPGGGWGAYLSGDEPAWNKIVISGHSQGAGTAAFIAKYHEVARVICFSGPSDSVKGAAGQPEIDDWISEPSKTPLDRWYGGYHAKEPDAKSFVLTYAALGFPLDHIRVFTLEPEKNIPGAYHTFGPLDIRNLGNWLYFYGIKQ